MKLYYVENHKYVQYQTQYEPTTPSLNKKICRKMSTFIRKRFAMIPILPTPPYHMSKE